MCDSYITADAYLLSCLLLARCFQGAFVAFFSFCFCLIQLPLHFVCFCINFVFSKLLWVTASFSRKTYCKGSFILYLFADWSLSVSSGQNSIPALSALVVNDT